MKGVIYKETTYIVHTNIKRVKEWYPTDLGPARLKYVKNFRGNELIFADNFYKNGKKCSRLYMTNGMTTTIFYSHLGPKMVTIIDKFTGQRISSMSPNAVARKKDFNERLDFILNKND